MSVSIITGGLYRQCCGVRAGGGGAPPYRQNEEVVRPFILVKKVEFKLIDTLDGLIEKIQVKLVD